ISLSVRSVSYPQILLRFIWATSLLRRTKIPSQDVQSIRRELLCLGPAEKVLDRHKRPAFDLFFLQDYLPVVHTGKGATPHAGVLVCKVEVKQPGERHLTDAHFFFQLTPCPLFVALSR